MDSPLSATTTRKQEGSSTPRETLTITDNRTGKTYEVPITHDTIRAADLRQIKVDPKEFGMMSYDPAFNNTASCISRITYIDGDAGILRHRGYPIEDLAEKSTYLETAYLLLNGELPTATQLKEGRARAENALERRNAVSGRLADDAALLLERRIVHQNLQEETVELGFGQRIGPFLLDRILRGHDEKGPRQRMRPHPRGDLALLHGLQQRGLGLRRRAVDLVG